MSKAAVDGKFKSESACRLCHRPFYVRRLTRHRIVPGAYGGTYIPINCVPLCRPCHDLVDHKDITTRRLARRMLRASLWPVEIAHALRRDGSARLVRDPPLFPRRRWYFNEAYPKPTRELVVERRAKYATAS